MNTVNSVKELQDVMSFISKFKDFVNRYGRWLVDYPSFYDKETLVNASDSLMKTLWYLEQVNNYHYHCPDCELTIKLDTIGKFALRCKCGETLWLCTYLIPSHRCNLCEKRFKCLTQNINNRDKTLSDRQRKGLNNNLDSIDNYKIITED